MFNESRSLLESLHARFVIKLVSDFFVSFVGTEMSILTTERRQFNFDFVIRRPSTCEWFFLSFTPGPENQMHLCPSLHPLTNPIPKQTGLTRVRRFVQDDGHLYVRKDQIMEHSPTNSSAHCIGTGFML